MAILLSGCGSREHRVVDLDATRSNVDLQRLNCELKFQGVADHRRIQRLGGPSSHTYEISNLIAYLDEQINGLLGFSETGPKLTVNVRHVYAQGKAMRGFYTVVLSVGTGDGVNVLRGRHDVTNWTGSSNEFQRGLSAAAYQALNMLHSQLAESGHCQPSDRVVGEHDRPGIAGISADAS